MHLNLIKGMYDKLTDNTLNHEKCKAFPSSSATRQGGPLLPLSFNVILEVSATAMRQEKERKDI